MKIAVLFSGDMESLSLGGIDRYLKSLVSFFEDKEITIFGTGRAGVIKTGKKYKRKYNGKTYYFIPISDDRRRPLSVYYLLNEIKYLNEICKYDYIYAQRDEYSLPFLFKKEKKKLVQIIHGSSKWSGLFFGRWKGRLHLFLERISVGIASKTFVILNREECGTPYYKKKYPKYSDRFFYAYNPIDTRVYKKQDKELCKKRMGICQSKIILYSGRLVDNPKRVLLFPDICKALKEKGLDITFIILGDGEDRKKLEDKVRAYGLGHVFIFRGYVEDANVLSCFYNIADVAVNISKFEGTCTSNLEAVACGLPVVSTDVGDIHEIIKNGCNGIVIPNNDGVTLVNNVADAIEKVLVTHIEMNTLYEKYAGGRVVEELKRIHFVNKDNG
ncbi:MAG: glycosyltransferase family 4 protein [Lachnospiraceae bacterium]|nr:glycosyltransferase family 4 protein [Lachnospiraceae bacterium]